MARDIEALQLTMSADIRKLEKAMDRAAAQTGKALAQIEGRASQTERKLGKLGTGVKPNLLGNVFSNARAEMDSLAGRVPVVGGALTGLNGPLVALAAAGAAAAVGLDQARKAMQFADDLVAMADKLGVGVEALQELRHAAEASDIPVDKLDASLAALNGTIGAIQTGVGGAKAAKPFAALDITPEQLRNIKSADELLPLLADKMSKIGSTAAQVQIARKLGIEDLLPLLRQGSTGLETLRADARELGIVMSDDVARRAADANEQLRIAGDVISKNLTVAFAQLAPYIANATTAIADQIPKLAALIQQAIAFANQVESIFGGLARGYANAQRQANDLGKAARSGAAGGLGPILQREEQRRRARVDRLRRRLPFKGGLDTRNLNGDSPYLTTVQEVGGGVNRTALPAGPAGPGFTPQPTGAGGKGAKKPKGPKGKSAEQIAREAEQAAREALQRVRSYEDAVSRFDSEELSARAAGAKTATERAAIAQEQRNFDRVILERQLQRDVDDKELTREQREFLLGLAAAVDIQEDRNANAEITRDLEEQAARAAEEVYRLATAALGIEANMATTLTQRAEVERRILALAQQEERERLEQQIRRGEVASPNAARYNLRTNQAGQRAAQNANPLGRSPLDAGADQIANGILDQAGAADRYAAEMARIAELRNQNVLSEQQAQQAMAQSAAAYNEQRLAGASSFFSALAGLSESGNAKLRAIGKAAAIAQATIDGVLAVQKALASAPPPLNFAIAAAVGATAALNVAKIAGFERGGYTGRGGRREVAGVVHGGEYVVRKDVTDRHRDTLEHLNRTGRLPGYMDGGFVMPRAPNVPSMERLSAIGSQRRQDAIIVHVDKSDYFEVAVERVATPVAQQAGLQAFNGARAQVPVDLTGRQRQRIPSRGR